MAPRFVAVPVPTYNPQLEFSLGLMGMVTYRPIKKDKLSPPWSSILFGMYTTNSSFALFARQEAFWDSDNNRAELTFGGGKFNSTYYGTGDQTSSGFALPLASAGLMLQPQYMRRVWNRLYLGARYRLFWNEAVVSPPEGDADAPEFVPIESNLLHSGLGLVATFDSRDNRFSPTRGFYVPFSSIFFSKAFGGDDNFANMDVAVNYYHAWFEGQLILASRGYFTIATSNTPDHLMPAVGMGPDLRGYAYGRYRDNLFMAAQAELRWYFWWKLGAVAWSGIGTTAAGLDKLGLGTVLPSYGLGLRFLAFEEERLVIRVDYGRGNEDGQLYFSVSEAF
jgi:outer membrane protein assembly factor BamA